MIKIEIFPEDVQINTRTTKATESKPAREIYEQTAYVYLGGKFPVQIKLQLEKEQEPYAAGLYTPHSASYVVNNFGGLELKKFGMVIEPLEH
ncbi:single-stranded DNA-binding protein [Vibrio fluvialis]